VRALLKPLFARSAWAQPASVLAGMPDEGAALASVRLVDKGLGSRCGGGQHRSRRCLVCVRLVGVGPAIHCGGGHDRSGHCSGLCLLGRRGLRQPLWWRTRLLRALLWHLFALSASAQTATMLAGTKIQDAALASVRLVIMGLVSSCVGRYDS
jgi:hypothetical protein